jgi:hypothetical protein
MKNHCSTALAPVNPVVKKCEKNSNDLKAARDKRHSVDHLLESEGYEQHLG